MNPRLKLFLSKDSRWLSLAWTLTLTAMIFTGVVSAEAQAKPDRSSPMLSKSSGPIEITSDRMRSENRGQKIIFSGNVTANWGDLSIRSEVLEIYNNSKKNKTPGSTSTGFGSGQQLDEIIAIGKVHITRGDRRAKGDRAVYLDKQQKIILRGNPRAVAWEGDNVIEGREMIFFLESDRFQVNDRVRLKLIPQQEEEEPLSKAAPTQKTASNPR